MKRKLTNKQKKELRRQQVAAIRKHTGWRPPKGTTVYMRNTVEGFNQAARNEQRNEY